MKHLLLRIGIFVATATTCLAIDLSPDDTRISFSGRWDRSVLTKPWCAWQGSSLQANIVGTGITAIFQTKHMDYVRVIVDGDAFSSKRLLLQSGKHSYSLIDNLEPGHHTIEVVKETHSGPGHLTFHGFTVAGTGLASPSPDKPRMKIQFYGDSNLAGDSLGHEKNDSRVAYAGCHFTFAGIAARMLNADYQNISRSGATILGKPNSVMSFYDRMDFYQPTPKWDFTRSPVDVCVVNIGANDINSLSKQQIIRNYITLLSVLRTAHPQAHIVVMNGYGWDRKETANYTQDVLDLWRDSNASRLVFPWLFNEWHGCEYDHAGMAKSLVDHLASLNPQWKATKSMDVMDGFGRHGNVANGSFEQVAPFGGFGWRYFQDGAVRIKSETSPDGEWFLRIPDGKQVHQPNPATKGTKYTYKLLLRCLGNDGEAKVRIEFRDQKWRNEIAHAAQEFDFALDQKWKEFTVTVDSPASTGDTSQDPWQVLIRIIGQSGVVDCDNVRLSATARRK